MPHTEAEMEAMTDEQLRELALSEQNPPAGEQPRDEQGRFTSPDATGTTEELTEETTEEPTLYRREIDLGDGSGKQVFEAETLEELVDKLADAQRHATRKIRDLNRTVKEVSPVIPQPKTLTPDEELLLAQQFQSTPSKAFADLFEKQTGYKLEDFRKLTVQAQQIAVKDANERVAQEWVAAHPDYYAGPTNGAKMNQYINKFFGGVMTEDNLNEAYNDLKVSGLLAPKPEAAPEKPKTQVQVVRRSSGLSARRSSAPPPVTAPRGRQDRTQAEWDAMSDEEIFKLNPAHGGW